MGLVIDVASIWCRVLSNSRYQQAETQEWLASAIPTAVISSLLPFCKVLSPTVTLAACVWPGGRATQAASCLSQAVLHLDWHGCWCCTVPWIRCLQRCLPCLGLCFGMCFACDIRRLSWGRVRLKAPGSTAALGSFRLPPTRWSSEMQKACSSKFAILASMPNQSRVKSFCQI